MERVQGRDARGEIWLLSQCRGKWSRREQLFAFLNGRSVEKSLWENSNSDGRRWWL